MPDQTFDEFANSIVNIGGPKVDPIPPTGGANGQGGMITDLQRLFLQANSAEDTSKYSYDTEDLSKKYAVNYKGIDNEQAYAQGQGWTDKMVNSVGKGLLLTGTTFLQGTVGLANGVAQAINDGRAASFYDNDMNKWIDGINKEAENNWLPNYYTQAEKEANWYSPTKLLSANFFWDGIVKNLGFAAGAALTGGVYATALKSIPLTARLFSSAKAAEALAATEEGLAAADKAASTFGKIRSLSDRFINSYSSLTTGGRALVSGLSTSGEAAFEAYNNLNEFRNNLISEYKKNNLGLAPTEEELSNINSLADSVGNSSFLLNVGLLTATNYIQFPKILGSSTKAEKAMLNGLTKEIGEVTTDATGKIIAKSTALQGMGMIGKIIGGVKKILPYTFSASEGFEEGAQYAIQLGTQDYYNKKNKGDAHSFVDSLTEGVSKTITTNEGMENILIGGLSGAMMMARGTYAENKEKAQNTAAFIEQANKWKISDFTKDTIDSVNRGTVIQEEREAHLRQGDVLESKDSESDYVINYLTPRIKYGRFDMVQADISDLKKAASTESGFAELQAEGKVLAGDTRDAYVQRLVNLESTANNMKSLYESLNIRYGNLITKDGKPLFDRKVMDQMLYAATKVADYDERSLRLSNSLVLSSDVDTSEIIQEAIVGKTEARDKAIAAIDPLDINKEDKIQAIMDIAEISARRQKLLEEYNEIKKSPEKFREVTKEETIIPEEDLGKIVKLTTRDGEEELEIGKEYYAGKQVAVQEKDGTINKFTKFTILGEEGDGIVLKLTDGRKVTIPKDKFKQFKLGNVASSERTDNVKFYIESSDNIFTYNLGKGKKYEGSISYDPKTDKLYFTSNDGKFSRQVTRDQFSPKEGFNTAQIYSNKQYTEKAAQALTQPVSVQEKLETRNKIIVDLYNNSKSRLEEVNKKLESNKEKLNETNEALDNLSKTKEGLPKKKFTNAVKKTISTLSKIKTDVETEIAQLKIEKEELEATLPYFQDLVENAGELPQDGREMLNQLKSDVNILEELIDNTNSAIASGESLIESIDSALLNALSLMNDFVKRLKEENPNVPLFIADLQEQLEKFQGEEGAKQFIAEKLGFTELVIDLESQISDFSQELKIPDLTNKIEKLRDQIGELTSSLDDFINEQIAKEKIISAFEEYAKQAKLQEEEEKQLLRRTELAQQFIGTLSNEVQNIEGDKKYEANSKKDDLDVVGSTITAEQGKTHQLRSNRFGVRFHTLENRDDIRGMIVTAKTENDLIPGLMASLTGEGQLADPTKVIALVMVNENGELVDEFGKPIPEGANVIESAVYQVFPADELEATYNGKKETMFRESTPDNIKASLKEQYAAWRKNELAQEQLGEPQSIDASFGIPEYAKTLNDKGDTVIDYSVRTNVEEAGLVTPAMLKEERVIQVATTNESISNGSVTFNTPLGRVFLKVPGGLVKVFNRKFNNKKATTIYNVIHQLAKNALADEKNGIKTEKSAKLINWLKSVVYWGIAKDLQTGKRKPAGYNNIWFEQVSDGAGGMVSKLYISGKGEGFDFTPSNLEANKEDIIFLIENLYHNVSATLTNDDSYNKPYVEILDIDENGEPVVKEWKNYQTYLLSSQGRNSEDVPLTTPFRPLVSKEDVNRKGVYFTLTSAVDDFVIPAPVAPAPKTAPKAEQPQQAPAAQPAAPKGFVLDGETKNIIENAALGKIVFAADNKGTIFLFEDENGNLDDDTAAAVKKLAASKNISEASAKDILVASIKQKIAPQVAGNAIPIDAPNPTPIATAAEAPISETPTETPTEAPVNAFRNRQRGISPDDTVYREKVAEVINRFEGENWNKLESWLKTNFPNVPVYRVKNIIQATNGRQAWGMFQDGAIYVYENAQVGTAYHEVFHSVWRMFTDTKERASIINEFKNRKGSFEDILGEKIEYSKATEKQIEEKLAEEFRDFIQEGKIPAKPSEGKPFIVKLFADLVSFIKEFFTGEKATSNTQNLFDKVGNGYYAQYNPHESSLSYAKVGIIDIEDAYPTPSAEFSIARVPSQQVHEIMQQMTYSTLADLIKTDKSLFNIPSLNKKELYPRLKEEVLALIGHQGDLVEQDIVDGKITPENASRAYSAVEDLYNNVTAEWESIVKKHEEYLKSYSIEFDENDKGTLGDESNSGKGDYQDARKIDNFRKANSAIKVLFATIPVTIEDATKGRIIKRSSIGGVILVPSDKAFITLKNKLHDSLNIDDMLENLRQLALNDPNYNALYERLTKSSSKTKGIDFTKIQSPHSIQLLASFFKAMKGQNADVKTVFVLPTGEVIVGDTSLSGAMKQSKNEMFNNIVSRIKGGSKYVVYDKVNKSYTATPTVKNYKLNSGKLETYVEFLKELGIEFNIKDLRKLTNNQLSAFREATEGLQKSISDYSALKTLTKQALNIDGRLSELGTIKAILDNPEFESTYFNISGERVQTYIGTNVMSDLYDIISKSKNINALEGTKYNYLLTDAFSKGGVILESMFNLDPEDGTGRRKSNTEDILKTGYVDGIVDEQTGKRKESSKLNQRERLIQEINLNLQGWFLNLVPGDASIEWMVKMFNDKNPFISEEQLSFGYNAVNKIFQKYFISEVNLSRDKRDIVKTGNRENTDLRFFKSILGEELHDQILTKQNAKLTPEALYAKYESKINAAVKNFIEAETEDFRNTLETYGIVSYTEEGLTADELSFTDNKPISEEDLNRNLKALSVNYMISNIEFHKLVYSDPYQYKDELKRTKNFNSPGQPLITNSAVVNSAMNAAYNQGYEPGDIGYTDFTASDFKSVTMGDVFSTNDLKGYEKPFEETDGGGYITMKGNRNFRIRAGEWNDAEEEQFRYDVAYYKTVNGISLSPQEKKFDIRKIENEDGTTSYKGKNPNVKSAYTPIKPIVRGSKNDGENFNDIVLDKFALVPLSFRILHELNPESNAIKLIDKMEKEKVDYGVYATGRKVGAGKISDLYTNEGAFNEEPFAEINNIPLSIMSVQSEVPSKDVPKVTQGSQITKLVTMDFLAAGVPIDFEPGPDFNKRFAKWISLKDKGGYNGGKNLYNEIQNNQKLLEARIEEGYSALLKKLGISKTAKGFEISNIDKMVNTLKDEILKREVNDNISAAFEGFKKGDIILEATPAYQQIRNILYSIADKTVIRPKISGSMKVQISSALLESGTRKVKDGVFESDVLKFYEDEDGKRVCEIMIGRWFKSDKSDEELLKYFNETSEGQQILNGVAFRIPTQKQNSIDVFKIGKFLPEAFGDSVVIPSALVKKAGSDFDIDKLSIYLKNVYQDSKGNIKIIPYFGTGEEAKAKIKEWLVNNELSDLLMKDADADAIENLSEVDDERDEEELDRVYRKSLENEYIKSLEALVSHPLNFENLVKPNSAKELEDLSKEIVSEIGEKQFDYTSVGSMLNRSFMSSLRHAFVTGKYAIGIAATSQTNHSQNQRSVITIDKDRMNLLSDTDKKWIGDANINLPHNSIDGKPTLSMIKNKAGKYISDIIGQFIDGYVDISKGPWIMRLGASPNVAGTWLFLTKVGVPINTTAYFMNQPIVRDFLRNLENSGYTWLFNDRFVKDTLKDYTKKDEDVEGYVSMDRVYDVNQMPSEKELKAMLGKKPGELSDVQIGQQEFILMEFLKYAKMAEQLFLVQQGSNFDTATINDPYLIFKKQLQLKKAQNTIISSVDDILDASFVGLLKEKMYDIRDAFADTVLMSDRKSVRGVIEATLTPYVNLSDRDFVKLSQKAVNDLFDWAMQNDRGVNNQIKTILLGENGVGSAAEQIMTFAEKVKKDKEHPLYNNVIINSIKRIPGGKDGAPNNLQIVGNAKVYDQNQIIYGFVELKNKLTGEDKALYGKLIRLAALQSGLTKSPTSYTALIPYDDFKEIYNQTLSVLEKMPNLADFYTLRVFERNNWSDVDIVPSRKAQWLKSKKGKWYSKPFSPSEINFVDKKLKAAVNKKTIPQVINISPFSREGASDFVTFSWENVTVFNEETGRFENLTKEKKAELKKRADTSFINKALFKKVYDSFGKPLLQYSTDKDGKVYSTYVYKAINAWGASYKAQEFYGKLIPGDSISTLAQSSVINNDFMKIVEVEDGIIEQILNNGVIPTSQSIQEAPEAVSEQSNVDERRKTIKLRDGVTYGFDALNTNMLEKMGYSLEDAGKLLKKYKC